MSSEEIREVYDEDTKGRRYHTPIITKKNGAYRDIPAGEIVRMNPGEPLKYSEFRELTDGLKKAYITALRTEYGVTSKQIAEMLGCNASHFSVSTITRLGLSGIFKNKKRQSLENIKRWQEFLAKKDGFTEKANDKAPEPPHDITKGAVSKVTRCGFTMKGNIKAQDILKRLDVMLSEDAECTVTISIETSEE